ncbi:halocyanin domain-containing protein [Halospeciosus flavus]|uniref:halocyanin domain-containing protein n=1 Tax=Halospeciosus flavus TaxID=3032283 RepID=UPI00361865FA
MQHTTESRQAVNRRTFLKTTGALAVAGAFATAGSESARAASVGEEFASWFDGVSNYDGVVDRTGTDAVTVGVGTDDGFRFGPAAIRVDPGTTVTWEWTGQGGSHNVVDEAGAFKSSYESKAGATFSHTFEKEGVSYYVCAPHAAMGMKGAIVVGSIPVETAGAGSGSSTDESDGGSAYTEPDYGGWFDGVENFGGTVDQTGKSTVHISVTDDGFSPAAVRVDPGATVVWEWDDVDTAYAVTAADGSYQSGAQTSGTFALTFDGNGISKYTAGANAGATMRGAIVVGAGGVPTTTLNDTGVAATSGVVAGS